MTITGKGSFNRILDYIENVIKNNPKSFIVILNKLTVKILPGILCSLALASHKNTV